MRIRTKILSYLVLEKISLIKEIQLFNTYLIIQYRISGYLTINKISLIRNIRLFSTYLIIQSPK